LIDIKHLATSDGRRGQTRRLPPSDLLKIGIGEKKEMYQILIIPIENML
jgi:hypothetical protein